MRVVAAANWWYRRGGLGAVMLDEVEALTGLGVDVVPFASAHPLNLRAATERYFPPFTETGEGLAGANVLERARMAGRIVHNGTAERRFAELLDDVRPDLVHVHNTVRQLSPSILAAARSRGIPAIMTAHDYGLICPQGLLLRGGVAACDPPNCTRGNVAHAVADRCIKHSTAASVVGATEHLVHRSLGWYTRRLDVVVAPSRFMADALRGARLPVRIVHLANGLAPTSVSGPPPTHGGHVLFMGRLVPEKGIDLLLETARRIPSIPFRVAGDGPMADRAAGAPANVRFIGARDPAELERELAGSRLGVLPSIWYENAPLSLLEMMRAGRVPVVTDMGGMPEMVGPTGIVVPPDPAALADAISAVWSDPARGAALGALARDRFESLYTLDRHAASLHDLYVRTIDDAAGHRSTVRSR